MGIPPKTPNYSIPYIAEMWRIWISVADLCGRPTYKNERIIHLCRISAMRGTITFRQVIDHILAVGDSYTAGIGSNGENAEIGYTKCSRYYSSWPMQLRDKNDWNEINDGKRPDLTFGACSGNVMKDLREKQLQQGDPVDTGKNMFTPIGKPQIAVLTISGNDAEFSNLINDCIFRLFLLGKMLSCNQRMERVEGIIASPQFKQEIMSTYAAVIKAGRDAKGAEPPEAFQAYVGKYMMVMVCPIVLCARADMDLGGYVELWNEVDDVCDNVYWNLINFWGFPLTYKQWLTRDFRKRANDLAKRLNAVIKEAANERASYGVIHVEGYNEDFAGRRFCEHYEYGCIHGKSFQDMNSENGFWSFKSSFDGGEGDPAKATCHDNNLANIDDAKDSIESELLKEISEVLVPNEEDRKKLSAELGPWNVTEGDWDKYEDIFEALEDRGQNDLVKAKAAMDRAYRIFHPKASGYAHFANRWMEAIKANRDLPGSASKPQCANVKFDVNNAYVARKEIANTIDDTYCPKLAGMTSSIGAGNYLPNTPETFELSATAGIDSNKVPTVEDCKKHFHSILDGCDVPNKDYNPMNWKAGGNLSVDDWTYTIRPLGNRPPAFKNPKAWCQIDNCNNKNGCTLKIWGAGWESSNSGSALRKAFDIWSDGARKSKSIGDNIGYNTSKWGESFQYELLDGHEWAVTIPMNLGIILPFGNTTANIMRAVVGGLEVNECAEP